MKLKRLFLIVLEGITFLGFIAAVISLLAALWTGGNDSVDSRIFLNTGVTLLVVSLFGYLATYDFDPFAGSGNRNTGEESEEERMRMLAEYKIMLHKEAMAYLDKMEIYGHITHPTGESGTIEDTLTDFILHLERMNKEGKPDEV